MTEFKVGDKVSYSDGICKDGTGVVVHIVTDNPHYDYSVVSDDLNARNFYLADEYHSDNRPARFFSAADLTLISRVDDFKQRLENEFIDLINKLDKLVTFVETEKFNDLEPTDKLLLIAQGDVMFEYAHILEARVARLK